MKNIKLVFNGVISGEVKELTITDMTSPNGGYTQAHAERQGKSYEQGRAEELFGDHDWWECKSATYVESVV